MEQGSLPERYLTRSVIKHVRKQKNIKVGAAVGQDFANMNQTITADGFADVPRHAWIKSFNNFACSGGTVYGARILMMLPTSTKESQIKTYMEEFNHLADNEGIQILGGHSQVSVDFAKPKFAVTMIGNEGDFVQDKKAMVPGTEIVMTKCTGMFGTNWLLDTHKDKLEERFSKSYLLSCQMDEKDFFVTKEAALVSEYAKEFGVYYMHDVSCGGIYGALRQMGSYMRHGFLITHESIGIKQETIEICEYLNMNPYMVDGTGSLLIALKKGRELVELLNKEGIEASVIGTVTEENENIVLTPGGERRCMTLVNGDEMYRN